MPRAALFAKLRLMRFVLQRELLPRHLVAALAGLALAAAFPALNVAGLAWVAPGGLLLAAAGSPGGAAFRVGYAGGLVFHLAALHWLWFIPVAVLPVLGWLALSAYLALYPALWVWICWRLFPGKIVDGDGWPSAARGAWVSTSCSSRLVWGLLCAAAWVALEMAVARVLTGFPWLPLGVTQFRLGPLVQTAAAAGVHGLSFLVAWFAVSLGFAGLALWQHPNRRGLALREIAPPLIVAAFLMAAGLPRTLAPPPKSEELTIALVQPSIPQTVIWNPAESTNRFQQLLRLSEAALATRPDLLVWPEAGVPSLLRYDEHVLAAITNLARAHGVWMIVGAEDAEPRHGGGPQDADYFNSAFLISPEGRLLEKYDKRRLVIFGEYIPLAGWLPFLKWFTPVEGGFTSGARPVSFVLPHPRAGFPVKIAPIICFEDVFARSVRGHVEPDTDFLLNLTNDGWFGDSAQQWQHAANAAFRAVENGLPLVRGCNNGITCRVDRNGIIREFLAGESRGVHGPGFLVTRLPLTPAARAPTFYRRFGDVFGWACVAVTLGAVAWKLRRRSNDHPTDSSTISAP